jgi:hypothetical protein
LRNRIAAASTPQRLDAPAERGDFLFVEGLVNFRVGQHALMHFEARARSTSGSCFLKKRL